MKAVVIDGKPTIFLTPDQARILDALLLDGADTETVAARAGASRNYANKVLTDIAANFHMRRMQMVVAFLRGHIEYVVV